MIAWIVKYSDLQNGERQEFENLKELVEFVNACPYHVMLETPQPELLGDPSDVDLVICINDME